MAVEWFIECDMKLMWRACVISATEMHFTCPLVCIWVWVAYVLPVENDTGEELLINASAARGAQAGDR